MTSHHEIGSARRWSRSRVADPATRAVEISRICPLQPKPVRSEPDPRARTRDVHGLPPRGPTVSAAEDIGRDEYGAIDAPAENDSARIGLYR